MSEKYPDLSGTNFPGAIDTFAKKTDPSSETVLWVQECYAKMAAGDMQGAYDIIAEHPELKDSQLSALDYNKLRDAVIAMQRWYQEQYQEYLANNTKQIIFSPTQPENQLLGDVWAKELTDEDGGGTVYDLYRCTGSGVYTRLHTSIDCGTY